MLRSFPARTCISSSTWPPPSPTVWTIAVIPLTTHRSTAWATAPVKSCLSVLSCRGLFLVKETSKVICESGAPFRLCYWGSPIFLRCLGNRFTFALARGTRPFGHLRANKVSRVSQLSHNCPQLFYLKVFGVPLLSQSFLTIPRFPTLVCKDCSRGSDRAGEAVQYVQKGQQETERGA